ncbi:MAG: efflux RND transporter periplasmic adaptor subunit [Rhodocyclaceae bacterium]
MKTTDISQMRIDRSVAPAARPRPRLRWVVAVLAAIAIAGWAALQSISGPIPVETATVTTAYPYQAVTLLSAAGYVVAQRKAAVSSKGTGRLEWLGVQEGSRVRKDEIIARLESRDVRATAEQAEANVGVARANIGQAEAELKDAEQAYRRARDLVQRKFASQATLDAAQARYNKARAGVTSAKAALEAAAAGARVAEVAAGQTQIRAPFDGVVLTKNANVGDVVTPFSSALDAKGAVVTMADMSTLEVEADVSESNLGKISIGQPCEIQLDAFSDQRFRGEVSRLVPTVDRTKATVMTKVKFVDRDPRILPEMSAKVAFLSRAVAEDQRKPLTVVTPDAVATRNGKSVIFAIVDGKAKEIAIRATNKVGEAIVVDGVVAGDKVVLKPSDKLHDGAAVKPVTK